MPSSTATNVAGPTGRLVGPTSRLAGPTQPAPETNSILEFRASCFAHLAFASSPHPATFLHTSRVSCVLHLLHPVQRVRGPPSGSDPNSRIHCTHSTNSTPSPPFPLLCCLCACFVLAVSGGTTCLNRNFPGENQKLSSRSTALFWRSTMLYNSILSAPNCSVTEAATSLRTCSLEQRSFQFRPPCRPAS
jgi:hypothetical protein